MGGGQLLYALGQLYWQYAAAIINDDKIVLWKKNVSLSSIIGSPQGEKMDRDFFKLKILKLSQTLNTRFFQAPKKLLLAI